jgi:hypothetical protein
MRDELRARRDAFLHKTKSRPVSQWLVGGFIISRSSGCSSQRGRYSFNVVADRVLRDY